MSKILNIGNAAKYAVFIGRFQPFHNAHYEIIKHALSKYDRLLVCVGSARQAPSPKNPFSATERIEIIKSVLTADESARVEFLPIRDYLYNDNLWLTDVQRRVKTMTDPSPGQVTICGRLKDRSSYYMRLFPQWGCDEYGFEHPFDATKVRNALINGDLTTVADCVPSPVYDRLFEYIKTEKFQWIVDEHRYYESYRARFEPGAPPKPPFAPIHHTADAVVLQAGHVLVVRRRTAPGKGLLALPGGFVNQFETVETSAIRELKEETGIEVPKEVLRSCIAERKLFDHPDRSLRGRVITTAHCIRLEPRAKDDYDLPSVKGGDDADHAFWMPLVDLPDFEEQFFEDHMHIIRYFTNRF